MTDKPAATTAATKEPGSDELLSSEAAIHIQDEIWESEKVEEVDTREFNEWYMENKDDWRTESADVEPTAQS